MALLGNTTGLKHLFNEEKETAASNNFDNNNNKKPLAVSFQPSARLHDWSELPRDISNLIADKMRFFPHLQKFGSACKEWRDIACEIIKTLPAKIKSEPPMLLLPYNQETQIATFLDMKNSKTYDLKMLEIKDQWICGVSNGWLAMVDNKFELSLFNTVTRARIKLPPLPPPGIVWFHKNYDVAFGYNRFHLVMNVALSCDPTSSDCLIAVIYANFRTPMICRLGDEDWTVEVPERHEMGSNREISFYQGNLFVVKSYPIIEVFKYHKQGDMRMVKKFNEPLIDPEWAPFVKKLVESSGDLIYIRSVGLHRKTWVFELYRFEPMSEDRRPWSRVYSLGDRSVFHGLTGCICMSVKEFPCCKPNCIYFKNDRYSFAHYGYELETGVYSLEENRVVARIDIQQHPVPIWSEPAIWYQPKV